MNRFILLFVITFVTLSCSGENEVETQLEESIQESDGIKLIPLYKDQMMVFEEFDDDSTDNADLILSELFNPNVALLRDCFGYSDSSYVTAQLEIFRNRMAEVKSADAFFDSIGFIQLLRDYEHQFAEKTGQRASGSFYFSFFERRICNFCGCDMNTMQMDLLVPENQDLKFLNILLPHEMNHNAFEIAQHATSMQETVLYKAIDEGFATLVSQKLADVSVEEAFGLSSNEFKWYRDNEAEIKRRVKPILYLKDEELWDPLSIKVRDSFIEGSPGNIGYYVGYRIIEEFLKTKEGDDKWKLVYETPVVQIYNESGW